MILNAFLEHFVQEFPCFFVAELLLKATLRPFQDDTASSVTSWKRRLFSIWNGTLRPFERLGSCGAPPEFRVFLCPLFHFFWSCCAHLLGQDIRDRLNRHRGHGCAAFLLTIHENGVAEGAERVVSIAAGRRDSSYHYCARRLVREAGS